MDDNLNESNPGNITQNSSNSDLNDSLPPQNSIPAQPVVSPPVAEQVLVPITAPITTPIQATSHDMPEEKYTFPDHSNKELGNKLKKEKMKVIFRYASLVLLVLSLSATGVLSYSVVNKNKNIKSKEAVIATKNEEAVKQAAAAKKLQDDLTAANAALAVATAPAPAVAAATTKKSVSTSSQESVLAPPAPPSD